MPSSRSCGDASKASRSPRSSPANRKALASTSWPGSGPRGPCPSRGAHLDHVAAGLLTRPYPSASSRSLGCRPSNAATGSASRRVWTAMASPLSSTNVGGLRVAEHPGQSRRNRRGRGAAGARRPGAGWSSSARSRTPRTAAAPAGLAHLLSHLVEPAEGQRLAGGPAGDHGDRGDDIRQLGRVRRPPRGGCGRPRGRRRSGTGSRRSRGRRRPSRRRRPARRTVFFFLGSGTPWPNPTMPDGSGGLAPVRAQAAPRPVSTTVSRSRRIGLDRGLHPADAEVERQHLGGVAQPGREVDGRAGDGAVPVVGADDLPARPAEALLPRLRPARPVMPGVVVDLDVDLLPRLTVGSPELLWGFCGRQRLRAGPSVLAGRETGVHLTLGRLVVLGGDVGDPGHRDRDHAEHDHGRREDHPALVATAPRARHGRSDLEPERRAQR